LGKKPWERQVLKFVAGQQKAGAQIACIRTHSAGTICKEHEGKRPDENRHRRIRGVVTKTNKRQGWRRK
jgi:hypothetical protein